MRSINNSSIANKKTNIRIIEKGVHVTTIQNVYINYSQDYDSLKRMIEISIRLKFYLQHNIHVTNYYSM